MIEKSHHTFIITSPNKLLPSQIMVDFEHQLHEINHSHPIG